MAENKEVAPEQTPATWTLVVDPKNASQSLVQYQGKPVADVIHAAVSLEPIPVPEKGEQRMAIMPVLTLKVVATSLALGTYDSEELKKQQAAKEPVQQELPLGDKKE